MILFLMIVMGYLVVASVLACITWTLAKEELFRPAREWVKRRAHPKLAYLVTCEYCLAHWLGVVVVWYFETPPLINSMLATWFAIVWLANFEMSIYGILRQRLKFEDARARMLQPKAMQADDETIYLRRYTAKVALTPEEIRKMRLRETA